MAVILTAEPLRDTLKRYIERLEHLADERAAVSAATKETLAQAKLEGLDLNALKQVLKLRKMDADDRAEHEVTLHAYCKALGLREVQLTFADELAAIKNSGDRLVEELTAQEKVSSGRVQSQVTTVRFGKEHMPALEAAAKELRKAGAR